MMGCEFGDHQFLKGLYQEYDKVLGRPDGSTKSFLKRRISIDIQCDLFHILEYYWIFQFVEGDMEEHIRRFVHEYNG